VPADDAPQMIAVPANSDRPISKSLLRLYLLPSLPASIRVNPKVNGYPATHQDTSAGNIGRPRSIDGSATLTILTSKRVTNPAARQITSERQRRGSEFPEWTSTMLSMGSSRVRLEFG
jgi:hypothetical protein